MNKPWTVIATALLAFASIPIATAAPSAQNKAQSRHGPEAMLAAERAAMQPFQDMAGVWRGQAHMTLRSGRQHSITQTERVGPFLDGTVMVMEGRGFEADGSVSFNALGIISYDPRSKKYSMRSYARGNAGTFTLQPTADGFEWTIAYTAHSRPVTMHYVASIKDGVWHEVGTRSVGEAEPVTFFEMTLKRVGDTDWPAAGAVSLQPGN